MNDHNSYHYTSDGEGHSSNFSQWGYGGYTDPTPTPPQQKKKTGGGRRTAALILTCALVGGGAGFGGAALYGQVSGGANSTVVYENSRPVVQTVSSTVAGTLLTPTELYQANVNSCVGITVETQTNVFGYISSSAASGSGFVISADGYIVTNYHVVESATDSIIVSFKDGTSYQAKLVGYESTNDVAVLKIDATDLTPVLFGDSDILQIGETVMAIGNPLGELDYSITNGIVSALDRLITTDDSTSLNMFQTNCAINPGNSGGPIFNSYGEVVGIATAKYATSQSGATVEGLGFAIPINDVKEIIGDLIEHGYVTGKPYMGVQVSNVPDIAQQYGVTAGAVLEYVAEGSCAQAAGLQVNDIITAIDETAVDSASALTGALTSYRAGDSAELKVVRNGEELTLHITFDERNQTTESANQIPEQEQEQEQQPSIEDFFRNPYNYFGRVG